MVIVHAVLVPCVSSHIMSVVNAPLVAIKANIHSISEVRHLGFQIFKLGMLHLGKKNDAIF